MFKKLTAAVALVVALGAAAPVAPATASDPYANGDTACLFDEASTTCFPTEADMDTYLAGLVTTFASCSTALRLYSGTSYGGTVAAISGPRGAWLNLSSYSFDNKTRSYKIGGCAATFAKNANGLGGYYPGSTGAGASSTTMASGWDAAISSIYIS